MDDDPDLRFMLEYALEAEQVEAGLAETAAAGLSELEHGEKFDCVVLDLRLPDSDGLETIRLFAGATDVPIVVVSGLVDLAVIAEARRLGVVDYVVKSWDTPERLGAAVNAVLESRHTHAPTDVSTPPREVDDAFKGAAEILLNDVQDLIPMDQWILVRCLDTGWVVVRSLGEPLVSGDRRIDPGDPLLALVPAPGEIAFESHMVPPASLALPGPTGIRGYVACAVSPPDGRDRIYGALIGLTTHDKPPVPASTRRWFPALVRSFEGTVQVELARVRAARRASAAVVAARLDVLTRLGNRRAWEHAIAVEESRCARYGHGATIACIDLDRLKILNDRHGHAAGDQLLRHTATVLRHAVRGSDSAYRVGGDEFTVLSVETDPDATDEIRERIRSALDDAGIAASVGVAHRHPQTTLARTWRDADADMYRHKAARHQFRASMRADGE